jgi:hypothetical protein
MQISLLLHVQTYLPALGWRHYPRRSLLSLSFSLLSCMPAERVLCGCCVGVVGVEEHRARDVGQRLNPLMEGVIQRFAPYCKCRAKEMCPHVKESRTYV